MVVLGTVYPKKYAHGFFFAVLCCGYTLTDFPISTRLTSLALWQSNDCPSASKATLMNMDEYFMGIHYERLHNHNKQNTTKPCAYFLGYTVTTVVSRWLYFNKTIDRYRCFTDTYRFCLHFFEPPSIFSVSSFNNLDVRDYVNKCISQFAEYFIWNINQSIMFYFVSLCDDIIQNCTSIIQRFMSCHFQQILILISITRFRSEEFQAMHFLNI